MKTLPTLTIYSTLAHMLGALMHLESIMGKILNKSAFNDKELEYYNTPIAKTDFWKFCISNHSARTTSANIFP
jgi:folate-dependent tRNA-U54 methylase TrmFO/GidA